MRYTLHLGSALDVLRTLESGSVDCCVTSPPYYGLRDYGTGRWEGGDSACEHKAGRFSRGGLSSKQASNSGSDGDETFRGACGRCGAVRVDEQIGLEETPDAYVAALVAVFREVRRVLSPTGLLFLNIADSYASGGNGGSGPERARSETRRTLGAGQLRKAPAGYKSGDLLGVPWLLAFALRADGWWLRSEITLTKCLSGGTKVYARTQKGEMPTTIKDLVRLDPATVQLWNGERWVQVVAFHQGTPAPDRKMHAMQRRGARYRGAEIPPVGGDIEVEFRGGERVGCTREHLWPTNRGAVRADELAVGDIVPHCRLPEPEAPRRPASLDDREVGFFVGFYLAEGCLSGDHVALSCGAGDEEHFERIRAFVEAFDGRMTVRGKAGGLGRAVTIHSPTIRGILDTYLSGQLAKGKHLHPRCWARSDDFLRGILEGYLEGDGHRHKSGGEWWGLGFTCNDAWAEDLRTLAGRLGLRMSLKRCYHQCGKDKHRGYRGWIRFAYMHERKATAPGEVVAIHQSRARKFWDIELAEEPHLFALASGILTHNCSPMPESVSGSRWERCRVKVNGVEGGHEPEIRGRAADLKSIHFDARNVLARYEPCPGCPRCAANGGLVLRMNAGRPTRATESLFMFARADAYYYDQIAVSGMGGLNGRPALSWGANGASLRTADVAGKLRATLDTGDGPADCWGRCNLLEAKDSLNPSVTPDADGLEVLQSVRFQIGVEAAEWDEVMSLQDAVSCPADLAGMVVALEAEGSLLLPVRTAITDGSTPPRGALFSGEPELKSAAALARAKVMGLELASVSGEVLAARITLQSNEARATLLIWDTLTPTHFVKPHRNSITVAGRNAVDWMLWKPEPSSEPHYACFPSFLPSFCIQAGTSERGVCAECRRPWVRVIHREGGEEAPTPKLSQLAATGVGNNGTGGSTLGIGGGGHGAAWAEKGAKVASLGWLRTCNHDAPCVPSVVLDPFMGTGTTGEVALKLGRAFVGIDLSAEYVALARRRLARADAQPLLSLEPVAAAHVPRQAALDLEPE